MWDFKYYFNLFCVLICIYHYGNYVLDGKKYISKKKILSKDKLKREKRILFSILFNFFSWNMYIL